jgi:hypothetical protein
MGLIERVLGRLWELYQEPKAYKRNPRKGDSHTDARCVWLHRPHPQPKSP